MKAMKLGFLVLWTMGGLWACSVSVSHPNISCSLDNECLAGSFCQIEDGKEKGICLLKAGEPPPQTCVLGSECPKGHFCHKEEGAEEGICKWGALNVDGKPVATVLSWKVTQDGLKKLAVEWDAADGEEEKLLSAQEAAAPAPLWLHGNGFEIEAEVAGPGAGEGFAVWTEWAAAGVWRAEGACTAEAVSPERFSWKCQVAPHYMDDWIEEAFEIYAQAGPNAEAGGAREAQRRRSYNGDTKPPLNFEVDVPLTALRGQAFSVCPAGATENGSGLKYMEVSVYMAADQPPVPEENFVKNAPCYDIHLPFDIDYAPTEAIQIQVGAMAVDNVGNEHSYGIDTRVVRVITGCWGEALVEGSVTQPLVLAGEHVVFGTSGSAGFGPQEPDDNSLYFIDANCRLVNKVHVGAVQGPMVALGGSGRLALAIDGGGPPLPVDPGAYVPGENSAPRLFLVDSAGRIYDKRMDCIHNAEYAHYSARFDKGLSLVSWGDSEGTDDAWVLSAPLNTPGSWLNQLLAYRPNASAPEARCIRSNDFASPLVSAPSWRGTERPVRGVASFGDGNASQSLGFFSFGGASWSAMNEPWPSIPMTPKAMAWGTSGLWASGAANAEDASGLIFWNGTTATQLGTPGFGYAWSAVAVDSLGRAYVVETWTLNAGSHRLLRFNTDGSLDGERSFSGLGSDGQVVGSPLLGEPVGGHPAELYVVMTTGWVKAFNAETLQELKTVQIFHSFTPIALTPIAPTAQPLLIGNKLWVVNTRGEVATMQVNSNGLSRSAQWPKHLRDNCNTGNTGAPGECLR